MCNIPSAWRHHPAKDARSFSQTDIIHKRTGSTCQKKKVPMMATGTIFPSLLRVVAASFSASTLRTMSSAASTMSSSSSLNASGAAAVSLLDRFRQSNDKVLLLDGGTGEELFRRGVPDDRQTWSATAIVNKQYHSTLQAVHKSYIDAGSKAITTNSYALVPGFPEEEAIRNTDTAGRLARDCVGTAQSEGNNHSNIGNSNDDDDESNLREALVLGSLGPLVESYRADLILPHAEGVARYKPLVEALVPHVDILLAETMSCFEESAQAIDACAEHHDTPLLVSYTIGSDGNLRNGQDVRECVKRLLECVQERNVELLGVLFNCAEPEAISLAFAKLRDVPGLSDGTGKTKLGAYANRLTPVPEGWTMEDSDGAQPFREDVDPEEYYESFVRLWVKEFGVRMIGGCCGITPEHIDRIHRGLVQEGLYLS